MASACPTPPTIPPCWARTARNITDQKSKNQLASKILLPNGIRNRGPGISFTAASEVFPLVIACLPSSICANTFTTQPIIISQRKSKCASAPVLVVAINSPEPTMEPARIIPGPMFSNIPLSVVGGFRICSLLIDWVELRQQVKREALIFNNRIQKNDYSLGEKFSIR